MVNERERKVAERYQADGWRVLRNGAPDFLMLKVEDGEILDIRAVEVKSPGSRLSYEQAVYRKVFEKAGIEYMMEVEP